LRQKQVLAFINTVLGIKTSILEKICVKRSFTFKTFLRDVGISFFCKRLDLDT
jgi:hypothetical protein